MGVEPTTAPGLRPEDPVARLRGVGPAAAARLAAAGVRTLEDLLRWFPRRVRQLDEPPAPCPEALGRWVRLAGRVDKVTLRHLPRRRSILTVCLRAADDTPFELSLFNQPYLKNAYPPGVRRWAEGILERRGRRYVLREGRVLARDAVPAGPYQIRYGEIEGVSQERLTALLHQALRVTDLAAWPAPVLPPGLHARLPDAARALCAMHTPQAGEEHEQARRWFALQEAVELFRRVERARRHRLQRPGRRVAVNEAFERRMRTVVPFRWTDDQAAAIAAIRGLLGGRSPMGLLLQGDVGTGKTAVALYAALAVVEAGHQVAFLAPTELLAEQHCEVLGSWLAGRGVNLHLLTSGLAGPERRHVETELASGRAQLVVGTHALLSAGTVFRDLGLVVIDEQHRFGVGQRMALVGKGRDPHVLVMTATPIPRTLALTVFGDLDVVELRQRPRDRRPVRALFAEPRRWPAVVAAIARRVRRGQRVYVVCPVIGEAGEKGGAVRLHTELSRQLACGLVHGRMAAAERQAVTAAFRSGECDVLVGTTVLEVGVDVPAATLMVVIGAERLGLATLHQLRGRVGRGACRGLCVLTGQRTDRIDAVCAAADGFELAERDLALRGPGELLGRRQSGIADLRALDPVADREILQRARGAVRAER